MSWLPFVCRYLTEVKFQKPVIVYNYPKGIKAFYMKLNDDSKTVAAMDVLVPKVCCFLFFQFMSGYTMHLDLVHALKVPFRL